MWEGAREIQKRYREDAERYQALKDEGLCPQDAVMRLMAEGANDLERLHAVRLAERLSLREAKAFKEITEAWRCKRVSAEQYDAERRQAIEKDARLARLMQE